MSFHEKRALVSLASAVLIPLIYAAMMWPRLPTGDAYGVEVFRFWGSFFIILIPVVIVAKIAIYILFSIINTIATRENDPGLEDERDKLIEARANLNSANVFALGFVLAMLALVLDQPPTTMFIILFIGGITSEIISELSQFVFYRRGF